jgi:hypothetical protein
MTDEINDTAVPADATALAATPAPAITALTSAYTRELADRILNQIEVHHRTLKSVCRDDGMPSYNTVYGWVVRDVDGFRARYHRALEIGRPRGAKASLYTAEMSERIIREAEAQRSLHDICQDEGMPAYRTVLGWLARHRDFALRFDNACAAGTPPDGGGSIYTRALADHILGLLASGRTPHDICLDDDMPAERTLYLWVEEDRDGFAARFYAAKEAGRAYRRRGTCYTPELATRILEEIVDGRSVRQIARMPGMPSASTIYLWIETDRDGFAARFHQARRWHLMGVADEMREIADDGRNDFMEQRARDGDPAATHYSETAKRSRLRIDVRRWTLAKEMPEVYGKGPAAAAAKPEESEEAQAWTAYLKLVDGKSRGWPIQTVDEAAWAAFKARFPGFPYGVGQDKA